MVNVTGEVMDGSGQGVPDVLVVFNDGSRFTTSTDINGNFSLDVPSGEYTVKAIHSNFNTYTDRWEVPIGGDLEITLRR